MTEAQVAAAWEGAVHANGTGYQGTVENARGYALVWSGPGIRTFTATSNRPIQEHEPTLFEIWVSADGYWCDHTKNLCPGELDPRYEELERQLLDVYERGVAHCRDGADLAELDRLIRAGIAEAGYPGQPSHPVAHGVGARAHEPPYAHQAGSGTIRRGMVLAIEPGIYWEGGGGLRIEDNWLITDGAPEKLCAFPDRILGTPISENAFAGLGGGIALDGRFRPVVEFMYADFLWVAADQLFNQIAKARHMFGGDGKVPIVVRSKVATGTGNGSQHSMDPAGIFATSAGWRIVAPSTPFDYVGLMNTALACDDPVVVLEHVDLYNSTGPGLPDDFDHYLPVGKAAIRRPGRALTVLTYLAMTRHVLEAVEETGVDAEVIDLRWLDRASLDWGTINESVKKTNNVLIAEQGAIGTSYGGWLADEIQRRLFDWLDSPVQRVTGGEASPSISKVLERAAIAKTEEVVARLRQMPVG